MQDWSLHIGAELMSIFKGWSCACSGHRHAEVGQLHRAYSYLTVTSWDIRSGCDLKGTIAVTHQGQHLAEVQHSKSSTLLAAYQPEAVTTSAASTKRKECAGTSGQLRRNPHTEEIDACLDCHVEEGWEIKSGLPVRGWFERRHFDEVESGIRDG